VFATLHPYADDVQVDLAKFRSTLLEAVRHDGSTEHPRCPECGCRKEHVKTPSGGHWVCTSFGCLCASPT